MTATTRPDWALGVTAVRLAATHPTFEPDLDRVAWWAVGEVMVAELITPCHRHLRS